MPVIDRTDFLARKPPLMTVNNASTPAGCECPGQPASVSKVRGTSFLSSIIHTQITRGLRFREEGLSDQRLRHGSLWVRFPSPAPIHAKTSQQQPRRRAATGASRSWPTLAWVGYRFTGSHAAVVPVCNRAHLPWAAEAARMSGSGFDGACAITGRASAIKTGPENAVDGQSLQKVEACLP
jgi:hypothetical protein